MEIGVIGECALQSVDLPACYTSSLLDSYSSCLQRSQSHWHWQKPWLVSAPPNLYYRLSFYLPNQVNIIYHGVFIWTICSEGLAGQNKNQSLETNNKDDFFSSLTRKKWHPDKFCVGKDKRIWRKVVSEERSRRGKYIARRQQKLFNRSSYLPRFCQQTKYICVFERNISLFERNISATEK